MKRVLLLAILPLAIADCGSSPASRPPPAPSTEPAASQRPPVSDFQEQAKRNGSITFRSWNGRWLGLDNDTDLRFFPDGRIEMVQYADGVMTHSGHYHFSDTATLTVELKDFDHPWSTMLLERDDKSLLLRRADDSNALVMGNRMGATLSDGGAYWPFRAIPDGKRGGG